MGNAPSEFKQVLSGVTPADKTYRANASLTAKQYSAVRALVIGIGYDKTDYKLAGTRNDAKAVTDYLTRRFPDNLTLLQLNDAKDTPVDRLPTKKNLGQAMRFLCSSAPLDSYGSGDHPALGENILLIVYYSGHGSQIDDYGFDERDGADETLCFLSDNCRDIDHLVDDEINDHYRNMIPSSADVVTIFDCCHSGSSLDLKYTLKGNMFVNDGAQYTPTPYPVYYIGGTIDSLCSYEKNGRGYLTQVLIGILTKYKNLTIQTLSLMVKAELAKLISPSLQTVTFGSGQQISSQQQFPL
jgi:hypothetical protein